MKRMVMIHVRDVMKQGCTANMLTIDYHQQEIFPFSFRHFEVGACKTCGYMGTCALTDIFILVCHLFNLTFSVPIAKVSNNLLIFIQGLERAHPSPLQHTACSKFSRIQWRVTALQTEFKVEASKIFCDI
jgi:hypothetical protein